MLHEPFDPFAVTTFCDDIRYELNGKHSLIGIYRDDMILGSAFPAIVPKIAVSVSLFEHPSTTPRNMTVRIYMPGDPDNKPHFEAKVENKFDPVPNAPRDSRRSFNFHFMLGPITFTERGKIKVRILRADRILKAGTLQIRHHEDIKATNLVMGQTPAPALPASDALIPAQRAIPRAKGCE